ncbi:MFS transporter [Corynebacterium crudilactis]|uniref:MFS transporter n=1 Tax=Corynebacterium crudilactis TaxID=1652495 RepID=A0A172QWH2_9CORY|nr:MFS transporter [Corynebacterium crudilactis]ANE05001.1 MFS transporter [Corynebacterium crudilactis]
MTLAESSTTEFQATEAAKLRNNRHRPPARAWLIVALLVIFQIIAFADKAVLGLVAPDAMSELGLNATQFGFIGSAFFFLYAIVSVITGILASKISVRWILLSLGVIWAVMQFPMLIGGGAAVLLATRIILGGAEGPATAMSLTSAHTWFHPSRRALPSNLIAIGSTMGPVFAAPFIAWVIGVWGWRWAFGALGIIGLVWVVAWLILGSDGPYRNGRTAEETVENTEESADSFAETDTDKVDDQLPVNIWRALFSVAFFSALFGAISNFWVQGFLTTWLPQYLGTVLGFSLSEIGVYTTFPWVLGALVLLVLGALGQGLMRRGTNAHLAIAVPFGLSTAIAGIAFLLIPSSSGVLGVVLLSIAGGCSLVFPMTASAIGFSVGPKQRPIMMATLGGFGAFGAIVSPILVGWLMTSAGYIAPAKGVAPSTEMVEAMTTGVNTAFLITGVLLVTAGLVAAVFLRPEKLGRTLQARYVTNNS